MDWTAWATRRRAHDKIRIPRAPRWGRASRWKPLRPLHDTHQRLVGDGDALPICADARVLGATLNAGETAEYRLPVASACRG